MTPRGAAHFHREPEPEPVGDDTLEDLPHRRRGEENWGLDPANTWPLLAPLMTPEERDLHVDLETDARLFLNGSVGAAAGRVAKADEEEAREQCSSADRKQPVVRLQLRVLVWQRAMSLRSEAAARGEPLARML
jgi:hypothetical protein